ncbi:class E sortase [Actinacidiphila reveromycinica]
MAQPQEPQEPRQSPHPRHSASRRQEQPQHPQQPDARQRAQQPARPQQAPQPPSAPHAAPQQTVPPLRSEPVAPPPAAPSPVAPSPTAASAPPPLRTPPAAPSPVSPAAAPASAPSTEPLSAPEPDETAQLPQISDTAPIEVARVAAPAAAEPAAAGASGPVGAEGGRAARRKAARGGHRARGRGGNGPAAPAADDPSAEPAAPLSRVEARRAAKAAKDSPAVVISRIVGELFITVGVVMLLFVTYQLWWTNVRAHAEANSASNNLEQQWDSGSGDANRSAGTFSPGQGFAIMYIPKLDVKAPIAQGVSTTKVLNKGMIGHYDGEPTNTAMPWDKTGNFAVAAHRNTHGEPFRYINRLVPGDKVVVETSTTYYTYTVTSSLATTPPSNVSVLEPVPPGSGFTKPGRYITLTTCTPEFTSTNRLIVWGKLTEERPRSKGKPDALVNG